MRYAQGALSGKYDDKVFGGLVNTMVAKLDCDERGVGMQNFRYAPARDELCHTVKIQSPRAFRALKEYLPVRSERSFRYVTIPSPNTFSDEIQGQRRPGNLGFPWKFARRHLN